MTVNVTPEVAAAHKNLSDLCEKFEVSVDEFCASFPHSILPHDFYEYEYVPIAVECVDALSELQSASSYEVTAYQNAIAEADSVLRQQKRELEENIAQIAKIYEDEVAAADSALRQRKRELRENAAQRAKAYENTVAAADNALHQQKRELEENANRRIATVEEEASDYATRTSGLDKFSFSIRKVVGIVVFPIAIIYWINGGFDSWNIYWGSLLFDSWGRTFWGGLLFGGTIFAPFFLIFSPDYWDKWKDFWDEGEGPLVGCIVIMVVMLALAYWLSGWLHSSGSGYYWGISDGSLLLFWSIFWGGISFSYLSSTATAIIAIIAINMHYYGKRYRIAKALRIRQSAAVAECDSIWKEMEKAVANASTERDQKVKEAHTKKEREDKQVAEAAAVAILSAEENKNAEIESAGARKEKGEKGAAEIAAKALAVYDRKIKEARSKKNQAMVYVEQEYQAFDKRLCKCLGKLQSLIDTWIIENADVTSVLDENRIQNVSENGARIESSLTRIGTVNIWDLSRVTPKNMVDATPNTTIQPMRRAMLGEDDIEVVKDYLETIAKTYAA